MSSRKRTTLKDHLTEQLLEAAENGMHYAIEPLVKAGACVDGFSGFETPLNHMVDDLLSILLNDDDDDDNNLLNIFDKNDYMLTFHALFECGANVELFDCANCNLLEVIYSTLGMHGVVLFLQYDVKFSLLSLYKEGMFSVHRAIRYHDSECTVTYSSTVLSKVTTGLMREFLMLGYDTCEEKSESDKSQFLRFAKGTRNLIVVEFSFSIDFIINTF